MRYDQLLLLALAGVICLIPLTAYLFWLRYVTKQPHPVIVSGRSDFFVLLLGVLGFVLFGGGLVLLLTQNNALLLLRGNWSLVQGTLEQERSAWLWSLRIYAFGILSWVGWEFFRRRRMMVVYNISPASFEQILQDLFQQFDLPLTREGNRWFSVRELFVLHGWDATRTVILKWVGYRDQKLFVELERSLRERLPSIDVPFNPFYLVTAAASIVSLILSILSLVLLLLLIR